MPLGGSLGSRGSPAEKEGPEEWPQESVKALQYRRKQTGSNRDASIIDACAAAADSVRRKRKEALFRTGEVGLVNGVGT